MARPMALVLGAIVLAGCASMLNTPQQDYVWAMGQNCSNTGAYITRVLPDGHYYYGWRGGAYTGPEFRQCMEEQYKARPYREWVKENGR